MGKTDNPQPRCCICCVSNCFLKVWCWLVQCGYRWYLMYMCLMHFTSVAEFCHGLTVSWSHTLTHYTWVPYRIWLASVSCRAPSMQLYLFTKWGRCSCMTGSRWVMSQTEPVLLLYLLQSFLPNTVPALHIVLTFFLYFFSSLNFSLPPCSSFSNMLFYLFVFPWHSYLLKIFFHPQAPFCHYFVTVKLG